MSTQQEVKQATKAGIDLSYNNAGPEWRLKAHAILEEIANNNQYIVSDMLIGALEEAGYGLKNYSALGGVFIRAAKDGYIEKTGGLQESTRARSHSSKTVWRSRIYKPTSETTKEQNALNKLIINALEFNAATVRLSSLIFTAGGIDAKVQKKALKEFYRLSDNYSAKYTETVAKLEDQPSVGGK